MSPFTQQESSQQKSDQQESALQNDALQNHAEFIFNNVTDASAEADLIIDQQQSLSLKANQGDLEEYKVSSTQIFGLRVIKDGKEGIAYSEADDQASLQSMVEQALLNASFSAPDKHEKLLQNKSELSTDDALLCPEDDSSIDEKIELVLQLEGELLAKPKIKNVPYNGVSSSVQEQHVFSTAGLQAHDKQRSFSAYAYALAEDGDKNAMEGIGQLQRLQKDVDKQAIITDVYQNCMAMLDGKPIPSKHYDVVFDKECQNNLFSVFSAIFSGKWAKDGFNPWREKVGEIVADERLRVFDSPLLADGFAYQLFDAEGTATARTSLISDGCLQTLLHNSVTASHFGVATTGHATRNPKSPLSVHVHQLEIAAGTASDSVFYAGEYVEITDLNGLHSGANPISGDFSLGASGYLCQEGERIQAVRGITVAGNFYKMLNNIVDIADKQVWNWQKSAVMPAIRFADLAVSGE